MILESIQINDGVQKLNVLYLVPIQCVDTVTIQYGGHFPRWRPKTYSFNCHKKRLRWYILMHLGVD